MSNKRLEQAENLAKQNLEICFEENGIETPLKIFREFLIEKLKTSKAIEVQNDVVLFWNTLCRRYYNK